MSNYFNEKPKAFISKETNSIEQLHTMLSSNEELYNKCISTKYFAYGFSQLVNRAIHFDYLLEKGIIPKDYLDNL